MTPKEHRSILARIDALMNTDDPSAALQLIQEDRGELRRIIRDDRDRLLPHLAGAALESVFSKGERRRKLGAFFTPPWLVEHTVRESVGRFLDGKFDPRRLRICDPACGSGNFLLGVVLFLESVGVPKDFAIANCVYGVDINPHAAALCRDVLASYADDPPLARQSLELNIRTGDALRGVWPGRNSGGMGVDWARAFPSVFDATGFDAVVGNPPYLNQLETRTVESRQTAAHLRDASDGLIVRYADMSAAFLLLASRLVRPGGRFAMVLPQSILSGSDVCALREHLARTCSLDHLWLACEHVFSASVYTCVISAKRELTSLHSLSRRSHSDLIEHSTYEVSTDRLACMPTWSPLASELIGVPRVEVEGPALATIADATADFRDEYYALKNAIIDERICDDALAPRILTTGLITPGDHRWGINEATIHGRRLRFPRADRATLCHEPWVSRWLTRRLVPKVLVASQTRVMECLDDHRGEFLPVTPLVCVTPKSDFSTGEIAAALSSPVLAAVALNRFGCGALHADSIKLSAAQLLTLPMPKDIKAWRVASNRFPGFASNRLSAMSFGDSICDAYSIPAEGRTTLLKWWLDRLFSGKRAKRCNFG